MIMGAIRCDIPTIFVSGGPMKAGKAPDGRTMDLITVFEGVGAYKAGKIDEARLKVLEDFSYGLNHADTGGLIAAKWNFPDQLVEGIKYHHEPLNAPLRHKDVVFCVYLANMMSNLEKDLVGFEQIEKPVLMDFGIENEAHFDKIHAQFQRVYEQQRKLLGGQST